MKTGGRDSQVGREKSGVSRVYLRADGSDGKESAGSVGDWGSIPGSLGWEDPLEKGMTTRSSTLAWRIPCTEEPGELQSVGSRSRTQLHD